MTGKNDNRLILMMNATPPTRTWTNWSISDQPAGGADASSPLGRILLYPLCSAAGKGRAVIVQFMLEKGYFKDVIV